MKKLPAFIICFCALLLTASLCIRAELLSEETAEYAETVTDGAETAETAEETGTDTQPETEPPFYAEAHISGYGEVSEYFSVSLNVTARDMRGGMMTLVFDPDEVSVSDISGYAGEGVTVSYKADNGYITILFYTDDRYSAAFPLMYVSFRLAPEKTSGTVTLRLTDVVITDGNGDATFDGDEYTAYVIPRAVLTEEVTTAEPPKPETTPPVTRPPETKPPQTEPRTTEPQTTEPPAAETEPETVKETEPPSDLTLPEETEPPETETDAVTAQRVTAAAITARITQTEEVTTAAPPDEDGGVILYAVLGIAVLGLIAATTAVYFIKYGKDNGEKNH